MGSSGQNLGGGEGQDSWVRSLAVSAAGDYSCVAGLCPLPKEQLRLTLQLPPFPWNSPPPAAQRLGQMQEAKGVTSLFITWALWTLGPRAQVTALGMAGWEPGRPGSLPSSGRRA